MLIEVRYIGLAIIANRDRGRGGLQRGGAADWQRRAGFIGQPQQSRMTDLHGKPHHDAGTILRPHVSRRDGYGGVGRNVQRIDGQMVDAEGAQVGQQQTPR